jgi:hypothetical protein
MGDGMGGPACDGGLAGRGVGRIALLADMLILPQVKRHLRLRHTRPTLGTLKKNIYTYIYDYAHRLLYITLTIKQLYTHINISPPSLCLSLLRLLPSLLPPQIAGAAEVLLSALVAANCRRLSTMIYSSLHPSVSSLLSSAHSFPRYRTLPPHPVKGRSAREASPSSAGSDSGRDGLSPVLPRPHCSAPPRQSR